MHLMQTPRYANGQGLSLGVLCALVVTTAAEGEIMQDVQAPKMLPRHDLDVGNYDVP